MSFGSILKGAIRIFVMIQRVESFSIIECRFFGWLNVESFSIIELSRRGRRRRRKMRRRRRRRRKITLMEARSNTDEEEEEEDEGTTQEPAHFGIGFWMGPGVPPRNHFILA